MRSEEEILCLVRRARAGDDGALEMLCEEVTDEPNFRALAERTAPSLTLVDADGVLQMLRLATTSAARDAGSMRWDERRGTPFKAWVWMVCHDRYLHVERRSQGAACRTAPGGWIDFSVLEEFGIPIVDPTCERRIAATDILEHVFEDLRGEEMTTQADVLELLGEGYTLGEIAEILFAEEEDGTKALNRVKYALKSARAFCRKRADIYFGRG